MVVIAIVIVMVVPVAPGEPIAIVIAANRPNLHNNFIERMRKYHILKDITIPASIARSNQETGCDCDCNEGCNGSSSGRNCHCHCS